MKSIHLSVFEKIELILLLSVYFLPILVMFGWVVGLWAYLAEASFTVPSYLLILSIFTYSAMGNFAPFFEVGTAAYLDNRRRILWMLPVLMMAFLIMAPCCAKALADLILTRNENQRWNHTRHFGNAYNGSRVATQWPKQPGEWFGPSSGSQWRTVTE